MTAYVKKGGGKRFGASGGKPSFGGARSGKQSFDKKPWGAKSSSDAPTTYHKATCSNCGESCEVPFRPTNGKPVFCRKCFVPSSDAGAGRAGDRFQKREYQPRSFAGSAPVGGSNTEILKQLEMLNSKLDRLIQAVVAPVSKKDA